MGENCDEGYPIPSSYKMIKIETLVFEQVW